MGFIDGGSVIRWPKTAGRRFRGNTNPLRKDPTKDAPSTACGPGWVLGYCGGLHLVAEWGLTQSSAGGGCEWLSVKWGSLMGGLVMRWPKAGEGEGDEHTYAAQDRLGAETTEGPLNDGFLFT